MLNISNSCILTEVFNTMYSSDCTYCRYVTPQWPPPSKVPRWEAGHHCILLTLLQKSQDILGRVKGVSVELKIPLQIARGQRGHRKRAENRLTQHCS